MVQQRGMVRSEASLRFAAKMAEGKEVASAAKAYLKLVLTSG